MSHASFFPHRCLGAGGKKRPCDTPFRRQKGPPGARGCRSAIPLRPHVVTEGVRLVHSELIPKAPSRKEKKDRAVHPSGPRRVSPRRQGVPADRRYCYGPRLSRRISSLRPHREKKETVRYTLQAPEGSPRRQGVRYRYGSTLSRRMVVSSRRHRRGLVWQDTRYTPQATEGSPGHRGAVVRQYRSPTIRAAKAARSLNLSPERSPACRRPNTASPRRLGTLKIVKFFRCLVCSFGLRLLPQYDAVKFLSKTRRHSRQVEIRGKDYPRNEARSRHDLGSNRFQWHATW